MTSLYLTGPIELSDDDRLPKSSPGYLSSSLYSAAIIFLWPMRERDMEKLAESVMSTI